MINQMIGGTENTLLKYIINKLWKYRCLERNNPELIEIANGNCDDCTKCSRGNQKKT